MPPVDEVSFELERFEWTADDRLEVVGRWIGVRGRRMTRPALTVEADGRRHRLSGTAEVDDDSQWRASFAWDGSRGDIDSAELELGRSLVVELPPPRRRRRRSAAVAAEDDLRAQVAELSATIAELRPSATRRRRRTTPACWRACARRPRRRAPRPSASPRSWRRRARSAAIRTSSRRRAPSSRRCATGKLDTGELDALRSEAEETASAIDELAGLRLAHGSLKAAHEQLEDELEALRGVRDERDEVAGQLEQLRVAVVRRRAGPRGARRADPRAAGARVRGREPARPPHQRARPSPART